MSGASEVAGGKKGDLSQSKSAVARRAETRRKREEKEREKAIKLGLESAPPPDADEGKGKIGVFSAPEKKAEATPAKRYLCSQCRGENPHGATHCRYCAVQFSWPEGI